MAASRPFLSRSPCPPTELAVVAPTTEGDAIVTFYRTAPGMQGFEMYVNGAFDRYGSGDWSHLTCPGSDVTLLNGCVEG